MIADVGDVEQGVLGQGALDAEEVALDIAVFGVFGNIGDVVGGGVEAGNEAARVPLVRSGVARRCRGADSDDLGRKRSRAVVGGRRGVLSDRSELRLWRIDAQDIAGASTGVVCIAYAESATKRSLGVNRVGEAYAGAEVGEVRIDQGLAVGPAVVDRSDAVSGDGPRRGGKDGLSAWIEVRDAPGIEVGVGRTVLPTATQG